MFEIQFHYKTKQIINKIKRMEKESGERTMKTRREIISTDDNKTLQTPNRTKSPKKNAWKRNHKHAHCIYTQIDEIMQPVQFVFNAI